MIADPVFLVLIIGLALFCLVMFGIPLLLVRYRPSLDDRDVELINTMAVCFIILLLVVKNALDVLLILWDQTGSLSQALFWIIAFTIAGIASMAILFLYTKLTGIQVNAWIGALAGGFFAALWFITSDLVLSFIILYAGFILLFVISFYQKKTGKSLDLNSWEKVDSVRFVVFSIIVLIVAGPLLLLMMTHSAPFTLLVLGIVGFVFFCKGSPYVNPVSEEQVTDLQEEEIFLSLPYDRAFEVCMDAAALFQNPDWSEIIVSDKKSGTISLHVYTVSGLLTSCATQLTMTLEKQESSRTRVHISGATSDPVLCLPRKPSGMNRGYVDRLTTYIRKKATGEKSPAGS